MVYNITARFLVDPSAMFGVACVGGFVLLLLVARLAEGVRGVHSCRTGVDILGLVHGLSFLRPGVRLTCIWVFIGEEGTGAGELVEEQGRLLVNHLGHLLKGAER